MVHGRYLDSALEAALATAPPEAALVQELAYGTLRWFHQLAGIAALLLEKPLKPKDQDVYALLLAGLYQLRHLRVWPRTRPWTRPLRPRRRSASPGPRGW